VFVVCLYDEDLRVSVSVFVWLLDWEIDGAGRC
jgi:hypothetical protein